MVVYRHDRIALMSAMYYLTASSHAGVGAVGFLHGPRMVAWKDVESYGLK
jgi:hypothetical protein